MKEIPLTKGKIALVDDEDFDWVNQWRWKYNKAGYAVRSTFPNGLLYLHRVLMNAPAGTEVDHKNGNGLDNRKENLRFASRTEQMMNTRKRSGCTSQFKGVYRKRNRWQARIQVDGAKLSLGTYQTEQDAALAYDHKARELFGPYAKLNYPSPN